MPRTWDRHFTLRLRLEDVVALVFFLLTLAVKIFFRELRRENVSPADVLIIIPAVSLLLAKELVHYFVAGRREPAGHAATEASAVAARAAPSANGQRADLWDFVRPYWEIVRDWFPFLVILLMYYSLWGDATHLLITTDRDAALIALDQRLFHFQASVAIQRFISPPLTGWMEFAYAYHIFNIPLVACFLYVRRPRGRFREMMCGVLVVSFFGLLGYLVVPAIGPMYTLRHQYTVPLAQPLGVFNRHVEFMDFARIRRDVFPSLHVGISFVVWLYARRNSRPLAWVLAPLVLSLWVSTVYLRYHYLVDCVAGLVLAPVSYGLANWMFKRFGEVEIPVARPAAWSARTGAGFQVSGVRRRPQTFIGAPLQGRLRAPRQTSRWLIALGTPLMAGGLLAAGATRPAAELDQFVRGIESRYRSVRTLRAAFTQTYAWGETTRVESGTAYFARGGLMRWDYREPKDKLVVSDGKKLWLYIPEEKQATRSPVKSMDDPRVPFPLLVSHFDLHRIFSKIEFADQALKAEPGDRVLRGYPKHGYEEEYSQVLMEVTPQFDLRRLVVFYPDRSVMEFRFDRIERDVALASALFKFAPPAGTEVIDQ